MHLLAIELAQLQDQGRIAGQASGQIQTHQWIGRHAGGLERRKAADQALGGLAAVAQAPALQLVVEAIGRAQGIEG